MLAFSAVAYTQCVPYTGQVMTSGNIYCLNGSLSVSTNISIPNGAILIIQSGLLQSNSIQVNGVLEIGDGTSVQSTGTVKVGIFGSQENSKIKLGTKSFLSLVGSVIQEDPFWFTIKSSCIFSYNCFLFWFKQSGRFP